MLRTRLRLTVALLVTALVVLMSTSTAGMAMAAAHASAASAPPAAAHVGMAVAAHGAHSVPAIAPRCIPNDETGDCRPTCAHQPNAFDCSGLTPAIQGCTADQIALSGYTK